MENGADTKVAEKVIVEKPVIPMDEVKDKEIKDKDVIDEEIKDKKDKDEEIKDEEKKTEIVRDEPTKELLEKIKSQVEFYFGDINLQRDKFLIEQTKLDDGWIPMTIMLNFKLLSSMSKDIDVILKALESSELIEISEDRTKIRRSPEHPLPEFNEAYRKAQAERTVYVKGFPLTDIYIQKLKEFFKDYEPFENIIMRKYLDKEKKSMFKGSIFIQFTTLENAKAFMARESIKYGDTELIRKYSEDYAVEKAKEKEEKKLKKAEKKKTDGDEEDAEPEEGDKIVLHMGSILHFTGATKKTSREMIKEAITDLNGDVAFVDFNLGLEEGWVRLQEAESGKEVLEKMKDNKLVVDGNELVFRVLEGDEETKYLSSVKETIKNLRNRNKGSKRGRSRRGRSAGQRGRKRHASPSRGGTPAKKAAVAE